MFRTVIACALVAYAAGDGHLIVKKDICVASFESSDKGCADIVEMGRCFAREGIGALPSTSAVRITAEHEMILAEKAVPGCETTNDFSSKIAPKLTSSQIGDLTFDVHEKKGVEIHRYKREIISLYDIRDRKDALVAKCAEEADVKETVDNVERELSDKKDAEETKITEFEAEMVFKINSLENGLMDEMDELEDDVATRTKQLKKDLDADAAKLKKDVDDAIARLEDQVKASLINYQPAKKWANDTGNPAWKRNYELIMVEQAPANTENGHAGRYFYKVNYNPNTVGFWYPNRRELKAACTALSDDLKNQACPGSDKKDGINRALKPVCDHGRSDGSSIELSGSYLSHCGCGSYPRERSCLGMSEYMLRGTVTYNRENSWNGCQMLRHDRECHHHWVDCYSRSDVQADFTICTSTNNARNKGPLAGCQ